MVVCAEVAKRCSDDDVTTEAVEMGGRPCDPLWKRERGCGGHNTHLCTCWHTHICSIPTTKTCLYTHTYVFICVHTETHTPAVFSLSLSHSPNTVVYCAAWPGPCPKAKRTQIAETEGPLLTGRPGCSCYSLLWPSKPMGTASWAQKLSVHTMCVCTRTCTFFLISHRRVFWTALAGADMAPQCNFISTGKSICLTFNSPSSPQHHPNALFSTIL